MVPEPDVLLRLSLGCDEQAPGRVREALAGLERNDWVIGDAMLIASELVTNAVRHSGATSAERVEVRVDQVEDRLIISVQDPGRSGAVARIAQTPTGGFAGYGLRVVEQLASRWGQERGEGYRVWAELAP